MGTALLVVFFLTSFRSRVREVKIKFNCISKNLLLFDFRFFFEFANSPGDSKGAFEAVSVYELLPKTTAHLNPE